MNAPAPVGVQVNGLSAVTCVSDADCLAVGSHTSGPVADTLVAAWDGRAWSAVPTPSVGAGLDGFLNGVTCVSASDCWAVGESETNDGSSASTLVEFWDGSGWSIVESPNPSGSQLSALTSVACPSASDCWAVGLSFPVANNGTAETGPVEIAQPLLEQWNGTTWTIVSAPDPNPAFNSALSSVTCVSTTDCWAVGVAEGTSTYQGLILSWNGTSWALASSPATSGSESNGLFGVTCASSADCWSVGYSYLGSGASAHDFQTWVVNLNAGSWSAVASPNIGADQLDALFGVACASTQNCWAVGEYGAGPIYQTLALQWDGRGWTIAGSANPASTQGDNLLSVTCTTDGACWAAGNFNEGDGTLQTLIEANAVAQSGAPGPGVPETPLAILLPLLGLATATGIFRWRQPTRSNRQA